MEYGYHRDIHTNGYLLYGQETMTKNKAKLLSLTLGTFLETTGCKTIGPPTSAVNDAGNYRWSQQIVKLPTGEKYIVKVHPLGHSKPEVKV